MPEWLRSTFPSRSYCHMCRMGHDWVAEAITQSDGFIQPDGIGQSDGFLQSNGFLQSDGIGLWYRSDELSIGLWTLDWFWCGDGMM